ncbi:MAG: phosphatase PAP2 family protein [Desulfuromonadaceae bacterium]
MLFLGTSRKCLGICIAAAAFITALTVPASAAEQGSAVREAPVSITKAEFVQTAASGPLSPDRISAEYLKGYGSDGGRILAAPLYWSGDDWLTAGLLIGATSGLYLADTDIRTFAQKNQSVAGDRAASAGNLLGNPLFAVPSLGIFYLYGQLNDDPKARRTSLLAVESFTISGAIALTIKQAAQRPRPASGKTSTTWDGPGLKRTDSAFPSIHTQTAFSIASVFAEEYGTTPFVAPTAYGLASFVGLSRIYSNKHWASDVFFGAAIGYFVGKSVVRYHTAQSSPPLKILPTVSQQGFGLMTEYSF